MTNREFYNAIAKADVADELKAFAVEAIEKLDARNEKRSSKPSKASIANEPLKALMRELLVEKSYLASEMAIALDVSVQKASNLLRSLVDEGFAEDTEVKVPKKGKQKSYRAIVKENNEE